MLLRETESLNPGGQTRYYCQGKRVDYATFRVVFDDGLLSGTLRRGKSCRKGNLRIETWVIEPT
jgi:hypothetical protein